MFQDSEIILRKTRIAPALLGLRQALKISIYVNNQTVYGGRFKFDIN